MATRTRPRLRSSRPDKEPAFCRCIRGAVRDRPFFLADSPCVRGLAAQRQASGIPVNPSEFPRQNRWIAVGQKNAIKQNPMPTTPSAPAIHVRTDVPVMIAADASTIAIWTAPDATS